MISFLFLRNILLQVINAYSILIIIYVLMSWFPRTGVVGKIYDAFGVLCDPYLNLFKKFIPPIGGMIDVSPIAALIVLQLVEVIIVRIL